MNMHTTMAMTMNTNRNMSLQLRLDMTIDDMITSGVTTNSTRNHKTHITATIGEHVHVDVTGTFMFTCIVMLMCIATDTLPIIPNTSMCASTLTGATTITSSVRLSTHRGICIGMHAGIADDSATGIEIDVNIRGKACLPVCIHVYWCAYTSKGYGPNY